MLQVFKCINFLEKNQKEYEEQAPKYFITLVEIMDTGKP